MRLFRSAAAGAFCGRAWRLWKYIAPACRALIAPIEMATGKQAYFCGKPNPLMMRTGLKMLNCHSAEAVMVGDRMDTDVISGMESGMSTVLVLSGVGDIAAMARAEKK